MGELDYDLWYDATTVGSDLVVETSINHGLRASDLAFDPRPGDWITVGDDDESPIHGQITRRDGDRVWVKLKLNENPNGGQAKPSPPRKPAEPITIVHTTHGMCLTTCRFDTWRDAQTEFEYYQYSLGPYGPNNLLEYLQIEYGTPPFDASDIRLMSRQANAFSWASTDAPPVGPGLKLGTTRGDSIRLAIADYQFPDPADQMHFSWYVVDGTATKAGDSWGFKWQALTCDDAPLICAWLFEVANWIERGLSDEPPEPPWLIEPNLQFVGVEREHGRAVLSIELDAEFKPPEVRRPRTAGNPVSLSIRSTARELRSAAIDFAATIARYPLGAGPSRPVMD